jgi:LPS-assembly protein
MSKLQRRHLSRQGNVGLLIVALCLASADRAEAQTPADPPPSTALPVTVLPARCPAPAGWRSEPNPLAAQQAQAPPPATDAGVTISSDAATLGIDGDALLSGNVELRQGERRIGAENVEYDAANNRFSVRGRLVYTDDSLRAEGESGRYEASGTASIDTPRFELPQRPARGAADNLQIDAQGRVRLSRVWFSTCPDDQPDWRIKARSIELDTKNRTGTGRNAAIEFFGVPIIYLPYISFPIGDARKSGFLFPSLGYSSRGGVEFAAPYYFNLAPQYDLLVEPKIYERRGIDVGSQVRYLAERHEGEISLNYLADDRELGIDRNWLRLRHRSTLPAGWRFDLRAESVGDPEYFEDFAADSDGQSITFLERIARISYRDDRWQLVGEFQQFQTLDRALTDEERPYARLPAIAARGRQSVGTRVPLELSLDAELVNFDRELGVNGWRADLAPRLDVDFSGAGWYLRPSAGYRHTRYELKNHTPGTDATPSRSLPFAAIDTGLLLARDARAGERTRLTLEPRLLYLWTPFRAQDQLPIFDTALPDLDFLQLFRTERYVGSDRIADANQLSGGVTSRLYDADTGRQLLAATLGQTYYFETPRTRLPGDSLTARRESDLIAQLAISAWSNWNVQLGTQWNTQAASQQRSHLRLQYRPDEIRAVNLAYRFQRGRLEQAELSGAWPVGQRWSGFARLVYDLEDRSSIERFAGIEYRDCCWRARLVGRRYLSGRTGERDSGIYLQLELIGLASVGSGADAFLEEAIRGYSGSGVSR